MKLITCVIDGLKPSMLERAVADGTAPVLERLMRDGAYVDSCVAAYPSVTPVCTATIATGERPDRHHIPGMNWFHRAEGRYVEYGSSFAAGRTFGISRMLNDTVYKLNGEHLSKDVETVFETLDDAGLRTAGTTFLFYRGRHHHEISSETALARIAGATVLPHAVEGPRELFYADLFASRRTGCRSQLGMPGMRDVHAGCVGAYLVEHDLFDFLLLSLPDNDTISHRRGPHAQVRSIAAADAQLQRIADAAGGIDAFLKDHALIVLGDHSHSAVEARIAFAEAFADWAVAGPGRRVPVEQAELALCPSQRSAMVYLLDEGARNHSVDEVERRCREIEGVDLVMRREGEEAVVWSPRGELRFAPGGDLRDRRGETWNVEGDLAALDARIEDGRFDSDDYPDALARVWAALACPTSGDVLLSARPGWEFVDWGGVAHVGGGSHGSLHRNDSLGALIACGLRQPFDATRQWTIGDVATLIRAHFDAPIRT